MVKKLDRETKSYLGGGLIGIVSSVGGLMANNIDDKLWRYSVSGWCLIGFCAGLFVMYKNDKNRDMIYKEDIYKTCDWFSRNIGIYFK